MKRALRLLLLLPLLCFGGYYSGILTVTTSGTAVQLSAASPVPPTSCITLSVTWVSGNVGQIYIGGSNVSAANKIGAWLDTNRINAYFGPSSTNALYAPQTIWVDAVNSGDKVSYTCYK